MIGGYLATLVATTFLGLASAAPFEDIVNTLPDVHLGDTRLWSGYMNIAKGKKNIHYLLVESQNDPATDPLILWFNGGPGCSSMLGFMQEHGPFSWLNGAQNWSGANPYSWNREANVLYIEQPAGVGYSYFTNKSDIGFNFTDYNSAQDNLEALLGWYNKYPEYKTNDLYITGESYAGVYVPYLMYMVNNHNEANINNPEAFLPPLKGIMVGNGVTNWKYDTDPAAFEMSYWHSLIDKDLWESKYKNNCSMNVNDDTITDNEPEICQNISKEFNKLWTDINIYDIFGECYHSLDEPLRSASEGPITKPYWTANDYLPWRKKHSKNDDLKELPPCTFGTPIIQYLNRPDVKRALNIPDDIPRADGTKNDWDLCRNDEDDDFWYESSKQASQWIYEALKGKYRILKYSGDTDAAVPTTGTLWWIDELKLEILEDWRPYFVATDSGMGKSMGGYIREYNGLTLGTVHGAGHMAPQFKPKETYHLLFNWLFQRPV